MAPASKGVGFYQINTRGGLRMSAARAYLWPAESRPNLRIETGALATRILFEGKRAVGVAYEQRGQSCEARAGAEVILSGGSINSPQLLQLSGIGPAALLKSCGIEVLHDSAAVGQNLQDHLCHRLCLSLPRAEPERPAQQLAAAGCGQGCAMC